MLDRRPIKTPCTAVCVMNPASGWCEGCFRTLSEIAAWASMSPDERERVLLSLPGRRRSAAADVDRECAG